MTANGMVTQWAGELTATVQTYSSRDGPTSAPEL